MKIFIAALALMGGMTIAYACTSHTYVVNGRVVTCTSCCYGEGNCQVNCY